jgi:hypothetical protein
MSMGPNILSSTDEAKTIHSISWWRQVDTWLGTDEAEAIHFHRRILLASNTVMMQHTNVSLMTFIIFCLVPTRLDETPAKHRQDSDHYYTDTFLVNGIECLRCWAPTRQRRHFRSNWWGLTDTWLGTDEAKVIPFINTTCLPSIWQWCRCDWVSAIQTPHQHTHFIHPHNKRHTTLRYDDHDAQLNRRFSTNSTL